MAEVGVVGLVLETKGATVVEVVREFGWKARTDLLDRKGKFLFHDLLILLLKNLYVKVLPWQ